MDSTADRPPGQPTRRFPAAVRFGRRAGPRARLARGRQVVAVLARHGLGIAGNWLPGRPARLLQPRSPDERPLAVHLREALEELGTTFIKAGQILSTHAESLPPEYLTELGRLQDAGPTVPTDQIRARIEAELHRAVDTVFASFDPVPLAAASIGQVHAATLADGREVVVKVQKPGVAEQVAIDLEILRELTSNVFRRLPNVELLDPEGLVEEFGRAIGNELDYIREGRNVDEFRRNFRDDPKVRIPGVHWDLTTHQVITLERLRGTKLDDAATLTALGVDRHDLALRCTQLVFRQIFEHGCFHADPHPGNILLLEGGIIGALDFGMVGRLDSPTQDCLLAVTLGLIEKDVDRVIDGLERLGMSVRPVHRRRLRADLAYLLDHYFDQSLAEVSLAEGLDMATTILRRHRLAPPASFSLLVRALTITEGVGRMIDPGYVATAAARPFVSQAILRRSRPDYWLPRLTRGALDAVELGVGLPGRLDRILGQVERGEVELGWRPEGFEPILREAHTMVNRLALSVLAAAFVIGVAVLLLAYRPFGGEVWIIGLLLELGLLAVFVLGVGLAINLLRARGR